MRNEFFIRKYFLDYIEVKREMMLRNIAAYYAKAVDNMDAFVAGQLKS